MNIEQLRDFCMALPGATEEVKWGNGLCFSVGKKMFAVTGVENGDAGLSVKTTPDKFAEFIERQGIRPADYVARYHWVTIEEQTAVTDSELQQMIRESYEMVFDKLPAGIKKAVS